MRLNNTLVPATYQSKNLLLNPLKPNGKYMSHLIQQSVTLHFVFVGFI
jgi:hypothetical protein